MKTYFEDRLKRDKF